MSISLFLKRGEEMYLRKMLYKNVGPINELKIETSFDQQGNPKPLILVGENGSGKSLLLSNIVDSLYELASQAFDDARVADGYGGGQKYYKVMSNNQIPHNSNYLCVYIEFQEGSEKLEYIFKSGAKSFSEFCSEHSIEINKELKWADDLPIKSGNHKAMTHRENIATTICNRDALCYFPPSRYDAPIWLSEGYHDILDSEIRELKQKWNRKTQNPITVSDSSIYNLQWLLDVITDSRAEVVQNNLSGYNFAPDFNQINLRLFSIARENMESIMSDILGFDVTFQLSHRGSNDTRFYVVDKQTRTTVIPTLKSLSTGQIALFNMFATIIRYADNNDVSKSVQNNLITGIVVIDEADLHLHSNLQFDVLPRLIRRFPKVQFIITSHSPLFVLGMEKTFGKDKYEIYRMPDGKKIDAEMFSEFQKAYDYMIKTQRHHKEILSAIKHVQGRPLIVTEGATDWKHMKAALSALREIDEHKKLFNELDFDFLEYEPKNSDTNNTLKLEMSNSHLVSMCENFAKAPQQRKIIFIADRDDDKTNKIMSKINDSDTFKNWGNGVYSFILPLPESRKESPAICIEHLYTNEEIKTEYIEDGVTRRLYMGGEFDSSGMGDDYFCNNLNSCGDGKINIIDGSEKSRVKLKEKGSTTNVALSKMRFSELVLTKQAPYDSFNFNNFIPIFETIKAILHDGKNGIDVS